MSRSGYSDDCDGWQLIMWRGAVAKAIRGKRGQTFMHDLLTALDSLPEKRLIAGELRNESGEVCALGALAQMRGIDVSRIDAEDREVVGATFNIAPALAAEMAYENDDDYGWQEITPEKRFERVRKWATEQLATTPPAQGGNKS